jgi:8-oxo-dGTP pyrophosphatase MutT (NUDIX family)
MDAVPPRDAATVILGRDAARGPEILLLERHRDSRFLPGAFAFPGGRVETQDGAPAAAARCHGLSPEEAARILGDVTPPGRALGFWVAALRELFEETGLLVARAGAGALLPGDATTVARLGDQRARCRRDPAAFPAVLGAEALVLALDRMAYCAHWITPEERPVRYDARFFVAAAPPAATPDPDGVEMVRACWLTPAEALARHAAGDLVLPFPTRQILRTLVGPPTVDELLAAARSKAVRAVRPRVVGEAGREQILLPGDPGYY